MANRKIILPQYGTVMKRGVLYYRTRIKDANGKLVDIYAKTPEELYNKETLALEQIENATFHRKTPTVAEYCEKWLLMQSVHVRATTLTDYTSKVRRHIIAELGDKRMGEVNVGCNIHYREDRLITVREALRLQSFPDSYVVVSSSKQGRNLIVGNAVPPMLAEVMAKELKKYVEEEI